jgi:hypothetical protein
MAPTAKKLAATPAATTGLRSTVSGMNGSSAVRRRMVKSTKAIAEPARRPMTSAEPHG